MENKDHFSRFPINVGIIGVGNWAVYGHIPALLLLPEYKIVALQSRRLEVAQSVAARLGGVKIAKSVGDLVNDPDVELVLVLNTAPQHEHSVLAAISAGKNVYSEWPFTLNSEKAKNMVTLANEAGLKHIIGLQRRFAPAFRYLKDLLQQGYVGDLRSVRLHVSMNGFQAVRSLAWTVPEENFSDVIAIYAGHFLDALFTSVSRPRSLSAIMINQFPEVILQTGETVKSSTPDQLILTGILPGNAVFSVQIEGGKRNNSGVQLDITGVQGDIRISNVSAFGGIGQDYIIEGSKGNKQSLNYLEIPGEYHWIPTSDLPSAVQELANLYAAFAADQLNGTSTVSTFKDAVWMHGLFDLMKLSNASGQRIDVVDE
ncbi:Gfo/Idh/MocA family oxidoreductase [Mucilaginibacter rigui]|uniref:Gfo/Idh/MocA family oxidoreductase n=1 Tax=Mucilaginibacter rigui TaxID=534635 RepID=A0ABR7X8K3_9SPHI|nr:Gfo/Idh/MocA family oxidoreductase [Mucilaginibacter rigui]MBD1385935.1 Gfo/Idh/MocA family oxidoreductase [Mucilaginibacter rigui]